MAMRAPGFDGAEVERAEGDQGIPADHPLMVAIRNAPVAKEPMTEDELQALEEFRQMKRARGA